MRRVSVLRPGDLRKCLVALAERRLDARRRHGAPLRRRRARGTRLRQPPDRRDGRTRRGPGGRPRRDRAPHRRRPVVCCPPPCTRFASLRPWRRGRGWPVRSPSATGPTCGPSRSSRTRPPVRTRSRRSRPPIRSSWAPARCTRASSPRWRCRGSATRSSTSDAPVVYVCNLRPQPGETTGYGVAEHVEALERHGISPDVVLHDPATMGDADVPARAVGASVARRAAPGARPGAARRGPRRAGVLLNAVGPGRAASEPSFG